MYRQNILKEEFHLKYMLLSECKPIALGPLRSRFEISFRLPFPEQVGFGVKKEKEVILIVHRHENGFNILILPDFEKKDILTT